VLYRNALERSEAFVLGPGYAKVWLAGVPSSAAAPPAADEDGSADPVPAEAPAGPPHQCARCEAVFPSRTELLEHADSCGHRTKAGAGVASPEMRVSPPDHRATPAPLGEEAAPFEHLEEEEAPAIEWFTMPLVGPHALPGSGSAGGEAAAAASIDTAARAAGVPIPPEFQDGLTEAEVDGLAEVLGSLQLAEYLPTCIEQVTMSAPPYNLHSITVY
jgi:hypothetical protein